MAAKTKPNEIRILREYDAPLAAVWDAWTDPEQVAKWWGPRGFTLTHHSKDLRPGGHWAYTMHGPDGIDYPNKTIYHEVEPRKRLVYDHGGHDDRPPLFRVTALFSESDGKTTIDMTMSFASPQVAVEMAKFIKQAGGNATWDRLAEYLEHESSDREVFVINRSFDAPVDVVYRMWTEPEQLVKWLPPVGFAMTFQSADIRAGGSATYTMTNGADVTFRGRIDYLSLDPTRFLEYVQLFCDDAGNVSRHPLAPVWPPAMLTNVTLAEEEPGVTRVTVEWRPHGEFTAEEVAAFAAARAGMTQGWTGSLDKLEALLQH